jgi:hypothetical protein
LEKAVEKMNWLSFWKKKEVEKSIYEKRISCLSRLLDNQRIMNRTEEEFLTVSFAEGNTHNNALRRLEIYEKDYKNTYEFCESILKPK